MIVNFSEIGDKDDVLNVEIYEDLFLNENKENDSYCEFIRDFIIDF